MQMGWLEMKRSSQIDWIWVSDVQMESHETAPQRQSMTREGQRIR